MNIWDIVLIALLAVVAGLAIRQAVRIHRRGGCSGCTGDCSACGHSCAAAPGRRD